MLLGAVAAVALGAGVVVGAGNGSERTAAERSRDAGSATASLSVRELTGLTVVLSFSGERAPAYVLRALRRREAAGVILFGRNVRTEAQVRVLTRSLRRAGGRRLLVMADQEGGAIRILPFASPAVGQAGISAVSEARAAGRAAAHDLLRSGVNVNLAPVAEAAQPGTALAGRTFPGDASDVASLVSASVVGYRGTGVAPTLKHFPGLGRARANTDDAPTTVNAPRGVLERDLRPFRAGIEAGAPLVMASHALYPAIDRRRIASQSGEVLQQLLREELGFRGVCVTDSLEAEAVLRRGSVAQAAVRSLAAGCDLALSTGPASFRRVHDAVLARARRSRAFRARLREAATRVLGLRASLALRR